MGVSMRIFTVYGVKHAGFFEKLSEAMEKYYDSKNRFPTPHIIMDGMDGEYTILGPILYNSGDERWGWEGGDEFKEIPLDQLDVLWLEYKKEFVAKYPEFSKFVTDFVPRLITFKHYS